jgi:hypothetical protein
MSAPTKEEVDEVYAERGEELKIAKAALKAARKLDKHLSNVLYIPNPALSGLIKNEHYDLLMKAHSNFVMRGQSSNPFKAEAEYQNLYKSLVNEEAIWLKFFAHDAAVEWAERCTGMIGTYATILRQRCDYVLCETVVFGWYTRLLGFYAASTKRQNPAKTAMERALIKRCLDGFTYKYLMVKNNLLTNLLRLDDITGKDIRAMMHYEIESGAYAADNDNWAFLLEGLRPQKTVTLESLQSVTDEDITSFYRFTVMNATPEDRNSVLQQAPVKNAQLRPCANCREEESAVGSHKSCSACKKVCYCSQNCQKIHWKSAHKQQCRAKD